MRPIEGALRLCAPRIAPLRPGIAPRIAPRSAARIASRTASRTVRTAAGFARNAGRSAALPGAHLRAQTKGGAGTKGGPTLPKTLGPSEVLDALKIGYKKKSPSTARWPSPTPVYPKGTRGTIVTYKMYKETRPQKTKPHLRNL